MRCNTLVHQIIFSKFWERVSEGLSFSWVPDSVHNHICIGSAFYPRFIQDLRSMLAKDTEEGGMYRTSLSGLINVGRTVSVREPVCLNGVARLLPKAFLWQVLDWLMTAHA
jgi:hypothetical protein